MKKLTALTIMGLLFVFGCSDSGDNPTSPGGGGGGGSDTVSFATDVRPIIQNNGCLNNSCHGGSASMGGLNLGSASYTDIRNGSGTNGNIVVVNAALSSNLYLKLTVSPPFGSRMPIGQSALSIDDQELIRDWINQGALDN